jgi:NAD-dependent DNA ligase
MNSYVRNLMTKLDVAPCFDMVIRDKPFDLVATLEKHEDIFHRTDKFFMVVHENGLKVPKYSRDRLIDRGCVGVVSKNGLRDLLVELKNKMHNDPNLKDMFMDPLRNTMKRDVPKMPKNALKGVKFAVTGVLKRWSREEIVDIIKKHGGTVTSQVSGRTDYLVAGYDCGNVKCRNAKVHDTEVLNESDFMELLRCP